MRPQRRLLLLIRSNQRRSFLPLVKSAPMLNLFSPLTITGFHSHLFIICPSIFHHTVSGFWFLTNCFIDLFNRDHAGGNDKMALLVPGIKVYGGSVDNVQGCTDKVENGDKLSIGKEINILCLHTPWYVVLNFFVLPSCHVFSGAKLMTFCNEYIVNIFWDGMPIFIIEW